MSAPAESLDAALHAVRERWGLHSIVRLEASPTACASIGSEQAVAPPWWPNAHAAPVPQLVELIGPASGGKLTLALLWLAALPSDGPLAIVDPQGKLYPPAAAACGLDVRRLVVVQPPRQRDLLHAVSDLTRSEGFDAVLAIADADLRVSLADAGQLRGFAAAAQTSVLVLREDGSLKRRAPAVATLPLNDARLRVEGHRWLWEDGELAGQQLQVRTERSRQGLAGQAHELTFRLYRRGFHGTRTDHLYLDTAVRAERGHARAAAGG